MIIRRLALISLVFALALWLARTAEGLTVLEPRLSTSGLPSWSSRSAWPESIWPQMPAADRQLHSRRPAFPIRMVKAAGPLSDPKTQEHIRFAVAAGFNALWIYSHEAGLWTAKDAPDGPFLSPDFVKTARWCRKRNVRMAVSVNPVADSRGEFVFHDRSDELRIDRFFKLLRRAGVKDFVLSFDDIQQELVELDDVLHYGLDAAPAHLDLATRLERSMRRRDGFWLCASAYCTAHLRAETPYVRAFLERAPRLPRRIGIVWTGPTVFSRSITGADLAAIRHRLGNRALLLYDNYPANDDTPPGETLGLILGPLRNRDAAVASEAAVYLACPMFQLGASRLSLLTAADYLDHPAGYDPDASWRRAILRLAGEDPAARRALYEQATDWGGWIGDPDYQEIDRENPAAAADALGGQFEPQRWARIARLYPDRMADLARTADAPFREELLAVMSRRLAIARAAPLAHRYFDVSRGSQPELDSVLADLGALRRSFESDPEARRAFDAFLEAAGIPPPGAPRSIPAP